jgi:ribosome maturation factor RimP
MPMAESPVVERVTRLVRPILDDLHLDLYDLEYTGGVLRLTADKPGSEERVTLDELALLTRLVNRELDHHEGVVPGNYSVEVTSPGLERNLRTPTHFAGAIGEQVQVRLAPHAGDERRLQGTLVASDDHDITIEIEGEARVVAQHSIERARTVFVWGPAPKPGKGPGKKAADRPARTKESAR